MSRRWRVRGWVIVAIIGIIGAVGGLIAYNTFFREEPAAYFES